MIRIILLDTHHLSRIGLKSILQNNPRFEIIGDYKSFLSVNFDLAKLEVDLFIIDPNVNKEVGFDVAQHIKRKRTSHKVVILSDNKEEYYIVNAIQEGVEAFIDKDSEPEEILLGINKVLNGQRYYSTEISSIVIANNNRRQTKGGILLTTKEREVVRLLMEGYSSKQIAAKLEVSPRTIHSHRANILSKLNLNNTTQLISKIAEQKLFIGL